MYEDKDGWKVMCVFRVGDEEDDVRREEAKKRDNFLQIIKPIKDVDVVLIEGEGLMLP